MLDGLSTIADQFAYFVGLPAMNHLEKLASLFSRQEYRILRLRSLDNTVVRIALNIRCSTWGFLLFTKSICDRCLKILLTKNKKTTIKMPNGWRTIESLVHKIRLHGRRGKEMAESFSREKLRHAPQKEGG